ncbi:MAG: hypothetical protein ACRC6H_04355 [Culicoidibacterales bacterium]
MTEQTGVFVWTLVAASLTAVLMLAGTTITGMILRAFKKKN